MQKRFVLTYGVVLLLSYSLRPADFYWVIPIDGWHSYSFFFSLLSQAVSLSEASNWSQIDVAYSNFNLVTEENAKSFLKKNVRPLRWKNKMLEKKTFKLSKMISFTSGSSM